MLGLCLRRPITNLNIHKVCITTEICDHPQLVSTIIPMFTCLVTVIYFSLDYAATMTFNSLNHLKGRIFVICENSKAVVLCK